MPELVGLMGGGETLSAFCFLVEEDSIIIDRDLVEAICGEGGVDGIFFIVVEESQLFDKVDFVGVGQNLSFTCFLIVLAVLTFMSYSKAFYPLYNI